MTLINLNHVTIWQFIFYFSLEYCVILSSFFRECGEDGLRILVIIYSQIQTYRQHSSAPSEHLLMKYQGWESGYLFLVPPVEACWEGSPSLSASGPLLLFLSSHSRNALSLSPVLSSLTHKFAPLALTSLHPCSCISNPLLCSSEVSRHPLKLANSKS